MASAYEELLADALDAMGPTSLMRMRADAEALFAKHPVKIEEIPEPGTKEAAIHEHNDCNLPKGESDGGRFGANADPRCGQAGGATAPAAGASTLADSLKHPGDMTLEEFSHPPDLPPVPKGHVRLVHVTDATNLDSILEGGLRLDKARGNTYGEPNVIWATTHGGEMWGGTPGHHAVAIIFDQPEKDAVRGGNTVWRMYKVPPERIVAVDREGYSDVSSSQMLSAERRSEYADQYWEAYRNERQTKEARVREFNDCNLPAGDRDGGRFGANDDPRCAGGAGSLHHGPVRPPRGKALARFQQKQADDAAWAAQLDRDEAAGAMVRRREVPTRPNAHPYMPLAQRTDVLKDTFKLLSPEDQQKMLDWSFAEGHIPRESMMIFDPDTGEPVDLYTIVAASGIRDYQGAIRANAQWDNDGLHENDAEVYQRTEEALRAGVMLGSGGAVPLSPALRDSGVSFHTHPGSGTFSTADVMVATGAKVQQMGVVGQDGSQYALRIKNWQMVSAKLTQLDGVLNRTSEVTASLLLGRVMRPGENYTSFLDEGKTVAQAMGWDIKQVHYTVYSSIATGIYKALADAKWMDYGENLSPARHEAIAKYTNGLGPALTELVRTTLVQHDAHGFRINDVIRRVLSDGRQGQSGVGVWGTHTAKEAATTLKDAAYAALTEFNPCHEPEGPKGGQFTFKGTGNCDAEGNPTFAPTTADRATEKYSIKQGQGLRPPFDAAVAQQVLGDHDPEALALQMAQYMSEPLKLRIATAMTSRGPTVNILADAPSGTYYRRGLSRNADGSLTATHDHFENHGPDAQGKALMQGQIEVYEKLGVDTILTTANISTGAYAWARYGFVSSDPATFAETIRERISAAPPRDMSRRSPAQREAAISLAGARFSGAMIQALEPYKDRIAAALANVDPTTPWTLSDLRITGSEAELQPLVRAFAVRGNEVFDLSVKQGTRWNMQMRKEAIGGSFNLGRVLLTGLAWGARLDLGNEASMQRLRAYLRGDTKVREGNDCNLPGGDSDGGQFGRNDDPRCGTMVQDRTPAYGVGKRQNKGKGKTGTIRVTDPKGRIEHATGMTGEAIAQAYAAGLDEPMDVSVGVAFDSKTGNLLISIEADAAGIAPYANPPHTTYRRKLHFDAGKKPWVYHEAFVNFGEDGAGKRLMQAQLDLYDKLGIKTITTEANISTGAYAWARYGFKAADPEAFSRMIDDRVSDLNDTLSSGMRSWLAEHFLAIDNNPDESAPWKIADLRITTADESELGYLVNAFTIDPSSYSAKKSLFGMDDNYDPGSIDRWNEGLRKDAAKGFFNLGKVLLTGTKWDGTFAMASKASRARMAKALSGEKPPAIPKTRRPARPRPPAPRSTRRPPRDDSDYLDEANLREFNDCNLPGGAPDGGQFGANADPRCAGENPGSLYHGPVRPPRGKAKLRDIQQRATRQLRREPDAFVSTGSGGATGMPAKPAKPKPAGLTSSGVASGPAGDTFTERDKIKTLSVDDSSMMIERRLGMTGKELAHAFTKYLDQDMHVIIETYASSNQMMISMESADGRGTKISRMIKFGPDGKPKSAYHAFFRNLGPDGQGKNLMRAQVELYEHLGIKSIHTSANINMGAYAWARYGFGAENPSQFQNQVMFRLDRYDERGAVNPADADMVAAAKALEPYLNLARRAVNAGFANPKLAWKVSDLRIEGSPEELQDLVKAFTLSSHTYAMNNMLSMYDNRPQERYRWNEILKADAAKGFFNLGRVLLTGQSWDADMDLDDDTSRTRLKAYIGDWTKTPFVKRSQAPTT